MFELLPLEHEGQDILQEQHPLSRTLKGHGKAYGTYEFAQGAIFNVFPLAEQDVGLYVLDVSGHGVGRPAIGY